jgi:cytochrome b6-f complex iron-sulfur subunit
MERKEFLKKCSLLCLSGIGISTLLQSCKTAYYIPNILTSNRLIVKKVDFIEQKKSDTIDHKWVLVKTDRFEEPIYLLKISDNEYSAVLLHCMHKGCEVNPADEFLVCPCHGSEYTATGKVIHGPAEQDLQRFITSIEGDNIYIHI